MDPSKHPLLQEVGKGITRSGSNMGLVHSAARNGWSSNRIKSQQSDVQLTSWHATGCISLNPMALDGAGSRKTINAHRSIDVDVYQSVLQKIEEEQFDRTATRKTNLRDHFIFVALRELGLSASELVSSSMNAFQHVSDPRTTRRYWIFRVEAVVAKGERRGPSL